MPRCWSLEDKRIMKTVNDLKSAIERHAQNIREAQAAISKLYATRPYTAKEAKEVKRLKGQISREEKHIAERRQDIVYLECTPPRGIEESFERVKAQLDAISREEDGAPDKTVKALIRSNRQYTKLVEQYKRLSYLMN